ncbi:hypothetical protein, partial [Pseudomonas sp. 2822-15]|uniref:hypothetical protein n=1 Tax=Pseudomonas sp. 2822-15 TaxID=1712677 RepID=UPI001C46AA50
MNENFITYIAKATPSDRLYLTYPLADDEGKSMQPSILLKRIKDFFPSINEKLWMQDPTEVSIED